MAVGVPTLVRRPPPRQFADKLAEILLRSPQDGKDLERIADLILARLNASYRDAG